jgi:hypothetical protein
VTGWLEPFQGIRSTYAVPPPPHDIAVTLEGLPKVTVMGGPGVGKGLLDEGEYGRAVTIV